MPTLTAFNDQQVLDGYLQSGSFPAAVYETFNDKAFRRIRHKGASEAVAEEIVQEAWIPFLRKLPDFEVRSDGGLLAYFQRTCEWMFYSHCDDEKRRLGKLNGFTNHFMNDKDNHLAASPMSEDETWQARKENLLNRLTALVDEKISMKCRQLIEWRYWKKMPYEEMDKLLGSELTSDHSSAKQILYKCRKKLKILLDKTA